MGVTYKRSGGIVGMSQRLELSAGSLAAFDRNQKVAQRPLTESEQRRLAELLSAAEKAGSSTPKADDSMGAVADGFQLSVAAEKVTFEQSTLAVPYGDSDGTPTGDLVSFLDGLLSDAVKGKARPTGMGPDDFVQ